MIIIRTTEPKDADTISCVLAASWKTAYRGIIDDNYLDMLKTDHWTAFLTAGLNDGSIFSMIIESNKAAIGAAVLSNGETESEANLISFYLLPDKIGQGYGHAFYGAIEAELVRRGFLSCVIHVLEGNVRAIRFYEKHGFTDTGRKVEAVLGKQVYTCMTMEKRLRSL